ncbi:hypothetical protein L9F63_007950, partial [Diploptera punctata]
ILFVCLIYYLFSFMFIYIFLSCNSILHSHNRLCSSSSLFQILRARALILAPSFHYASTYNIDG